MRSVRLFPLIAIAVLVIGMFTPAASAQSCTAVAPTISYTPSDICDNTTVTASVDNASAFTSFSWAVVNGTIYQPANGASVYVTATGAAPLQLAVTVADINGCTATSSVAIPLDPSAPTITLDTPEVCGSATDTATVPVVSGWGYSWTIANGIIDSSGMGNSVTFHADPNANGQPIALTVHAGSATCRWDVTTTVPVIPQITLATPDICPAGTDTASVAASNGATYSWSITGGSITSGQGTNSIVFAYDGYSPSVSVSVNETDASGCTGTQTVSVPLRQIPQPTITLATPDVCPAGTDVATVPASYAGYYWSVSNAFIVSGDGTNSITFAPNTMAQGPIGISVSVRDVDGCSTFANTVSVPLRTIPQPTITLATPDVCPAGTDVASVPASYAAYYWSVSNAFIVSGDGTNSITFAPNTMSQYPIGISVSVRDADGCSTFANTVTVPLRTIPQPTITLATPDVCPAGTDVASVPASYAAYYWSVSNAFIVSGDGTNSITFAPNTMSQYPIGISVSVRDADGCSTFANTVTVPLRTIPQPTITLATPDVCPSGTDVASVPATYAAYYWSVSNAFIVSGDGTNAITFAPDMMAQNPIGISVSVRDADGCSTFANTVTVPLRTIAPPPITLTTNDLCALGQDTATVPAGYANYSWSITNGQLLSANGTNSMLFARTSLNEDPVVLSVVVNDAAGCSVSNSVNVPVGQPTPPTITLSPAQYCPLGTNVASVPSGWSHYSWFIQNGIIGGGSTNGPSIMFSTGDPSQPTIVGVDVYNADGCTVRATLTVPIAPAPTIAGPTTICAGATATLTASSGASYQWSTGATTQAITVSAAGSYTVTVTDANGCSQSASVNLSVDTPATPTITASGPTTFCAGGSVTLTASAGASYAWSNGATTQSINVTASGSYTVTVTDAGGCGATSAATTVTVNPAPATPTVTATAIYLCPGASSTLSTNATAASYLWSNGATTQSITVTAPGSYTVTVTDANGCSATSSATSLYADTPTATITASGPTTFCAGTTVTLTANSGLTYHWSNGATTQSITVSYSGTFSVTVMDTVGCSATSSPVTTTEIYGPGYVNVSPYPSTYNSAPDGSLTVGYCPATAVTITAGAGAASYSWSTGATTQSITVSAAGTYTVTEVGTNGCSNTIPVTVYYLSAPTPVISSNGPTTSCGPVTLTTTNPVGASLQWEGINTGFLTDPNNPTQLVVRQTGDYRVLYQYTNGCTSYSDYTHVEILPQSTFTLPNPSYFCPGASVTLTPTGNLPTGTTYLWSTGETTPTITVSTAGTYSLTTTSPYGCTYTGGTQVNARSAVTPTINVIGGNTKLCGSATVQLQTNLGTGETAVWSNGSTADLITVGAGTYTVTVTDTNGCSMTSAPVTITQFANPPTPVITASSTAFCPGGTVTLTAPSGYASYIWTDNGTQSAWTQSMVVGSSGSYAVTVIDANGCRATSQPMAISADTPTATITASGPTTFCAGGSVTLTANSGASYSWSNGATTQSITVSAGGSYRVTVTDSNGCSATSAATTVTVNPLPTATITASGPTTFCAGGSVTLTPSAASSYLWSNGATTPSITVASSGSFTVTVTDSNGCSATSAATTVTVNPLPDSTIQVAKQNTYAAAPPSAQSLAPKTDGAPTYSYCGPTTLNLYNLTSGVSHLWSTGATTASIQVTTSGTYSLTVTDANGCSTTSSVVVSTNPIPTATITASNACAQSGGTTLTASAGDSYLWSDNETTQSIMVTDGGTYSVTVTTNGCSATSATYTVGQPGSVAISGPAAVCYGSAANLTANDIGGVAPFTYSWSVNGTQVGQGASFTDTPPTTTTYVLTRVDAHGCSIASAPFTVTVNPIPSGAIYANSGVCPGASVTATGYPSAGSGATFDQWSITNGTITATNGNQVTFTAGTSGSVTLSARLTSPAGCSTTITATMPIDVVPTPSVTASGPTTFCAGGSVTLTAPAGYSYSWSNGATTQSISASSAGAYSVTVTDANGCSATSAATNVSVIPLPATTITAGGPTTFCAGGSVTLTAPNGYAYSWSNGATTQSINVTLSGSYTVTVTDANGCSAISAPTVVTVNANPTTPTITASGPTTFCAGGSVTLTAPSGYAYSWSNGATTQSINVTSSGSYSVTVTDANGCSATSAATAVTLDALATPTVTASGPTTFCAGGSVTLTAPSGYTYSWSNGATTQSINVTTSGSYSVRITDGNSCSASSAATAVTVNPVPVITFSTPSLVCGTNEAAQEITPISNATAYDWTIANGVITQNAGHRVYFTANAGGSSVTLTVRVTDTNGCSATNSITLPVNAMPPTTITPSGATTFCAGGAVTLTAPSGNTYSWSTGATTQSIVASASGSYTVTVTAASGCSATSSPTVVTVEANPATPTITASGPTTFCAGGSVTLTAPSGYSYSWSGGATTQSINVASSGSYSVTVTDANGCSAASAPMNVTVNPLPAATITASGPTTFCAGGSVTLTASTGASYSWSTGATTQSINATSSGSYTVTVTDANGCSATSAATVVTVNANPATPTITPSGPTTFCAGGSVTLTAPAGYGYSWSTGATTQSINVTASGSFTVTVTDANGCRATSAATSVTVNPSPTITSFGPTSQSVKKNGIAQAIKVTASGSGTITYQWYSGASGNTASPISGATSSSYTPPTFNRGTFSYWVRVKIGSCSADSTTATVSVN